MRSNLSGALVEWDEVLIYGRIHLRSSSITETFGCGVAKSYEIESERADIYLGVRASRSRARRSHSNDNRSTGHDMKK